LISRKELVAELHGLGVTRNGYGLIDKQPLTVLVGMIQKARDDANARAAGAGPCPDHPDQVEGVCPYCCGIWAGETDTPPCGPRARSWFFTTIYGHPMLDVAMEGLEG